MFEVYTTGFMRSDREVLESTGETQVELMQGLCNLIKRNYKRKDFGEVNELTKMHSLVNSSLDTISEQLSTSSSVEEVED